MIESLPFGNFSKNELESLESCSLPNELIRQIMLNEFCS